MKLLLATKNRGKIDELQELLSGLPIEIKGLLDFPAKSIPEIDETGTTFAENARIKAVGYAKALAIMAMADDSGLEIAVLGGAPGVHSARYGGRIGYDEKIAKLLEEIESKNSTDRTARFVSHIALAEPSGSVRFEAEGICEGSIAECARGSNGFGYDPVFIPIGFDETFGELPSEIKQKLSHRAIATAKIIRFLRDFA